MPLGNPIRKQNESRMVSVLATEGQTVFTVQGGYIINHLSVFRNGVRLSPAEDFTAGDGSTVTLNNAANIDDRIDFHIFDRFTVQNAIIGAASTQTINGDLVLNGKLFGQLDVPSINLTGIVTATELDLNGKGDISGDLNVVGVTTVGKQVHVGTGVSIAAGGLNVTAGISTFQAVQGTTGTFSGAVSGTTGTFSGAVSGTTGTFSGAVSGTTGTFTSPVLISDGSVSAGGLAFADDTDTGMFSVAQNTINFATAGVERLEMGTSLTVFNDGGADVDFRIEGDTDANLFKLDAGTDRIGLGVAAPSAKLQVLEDVYVKGSSGDGSVGIQIRSGASAISNQHQIRTGGGSGDQLFIEALGGSSAIVTKVAGSERLRITSAGNVGINESSPSHKLVVGGDIGIGFNTPTDAGRQLNFNVNRGSAGDTLANINWQWNSKFVAQIRGIAGSDTSNKDDAHLAFFTSSANNLAERLRITKDGNVLINKTTDRNVYYGGTFSGYLQVEGTGNLSRLTQLIHNQNAQNQHILVIGKSRGTSVGSYTAVQASDYLGTLSFQGADGDAMIEGARIDCLVDGTPGNNDMPGRLMFGTTPDGGSSTVERMRIDSAGQVGINDTSPDAELSVAAVTGNAPHVDIGQAGGNRLKLGYEGNNCFFGASSSTGMMIFKNNVNADGHPQASGTERMRIDGSGRLMINTTTSTSNQSGALNVFGTDGNTAFVSIRRGSNDASGPRLAFCKNRNTTDGSYSGGTVQSGDGLGTIHFYANDSQGFEEGASIAAEIDAAPGSNDVPTRLIFSTTPDGSDTKIERMRVSASGAVHIGYNSSDGKYLNVAEPNVTNGHSIYLRGNTSSSNSNNRVLNCDLHGFYRQSYGQTGFRFRNKDSVSHNRAARVHLYLNDNDVEVGSIMLGASGSSFNTSSDYRLKENEVLISDGITRLKQLKPYRFNFKNTPSVTQDGFFAHEVSPVVPEAVTGEKDAMVPNAWYQDGDTIPSGKSVGDVKGYSSTEKEIQSLDYAKITPLLTAALQEAIAKIETLEAKVAALEGS